MPRLLQPRYCEVTWCNKEHFGHGWCQGHYTRWRKHGDPLGGGTSHGDGLRFIQTTAAEHESDDCLIWPYGRNGEGYAVVCVDGKHQLVSRLICENVNGPAPSDGHQAAHSCGKGKGGCVARTHLRWATQRENEADKILHGTEVRGSRQGGSKLTEETVREIRGIPDGTSSRVIAARYGLHHRYVRGLRAGRTWAWLS